MAPMKAFRRLLVESPRRGRESGRPVRRGLFLGRSLRGPAVKANSRKSLISTITADISHAETPEAGRENPRIRVVSARSFSGNKTGVRPGLMAGCPPLC